MLRSIYHLPCSSGTGSVAGASSLHIGGGFKLLRCAGHQLECVSLSLSEYGSVSWDVTTCDLNGVSGAAQLVAVHAFTQRLPTANAAQSQLPIVAMLALPAPDKAFTLHLCGASLFPGQPLDVVLRDAFVLELDFIPAALSSVVISNAQQRGLLPGAIVVTGSCRDVRVYAQHASSRAFSLLSDGAAAVASSTSNSNNQNAVAPLPPIVPSIRANVMSIDIRYMTNPGVSDVKVCVSAFGCDDGTVVVAFDGAERHRVQLDGPISSVCLFSETPRAVGRSARQEIWRDSQPLVSWTPDTQKAGINWGSFVSTSKSSRSADAVAQLNKLRNSAATCSAYSKDERAINLAVGGAIGFAMVFDDVFERGLDQSVVLTQDQDCVTALAASDFDCDGKDELVVGTYGGTILIYGRSEAKHWELKCSVAFGAPIFSFFVLKEIDVVPYLLLSSAAAFDMLGPPLATMEKVLIERMEQLAKQ